MFPAPLTTEKPYEADILSHRPAVFTKGKGGLSSVRPRYSGSRVRRMQQKVRGTETFLSRWLEGVALRESVLVFMDVGILSGMVPWVVRACRAEISGTRGSDVQRASGSSHSAGDEISLHIMV